MRNILVIKQLAHKYFINLILTRSYHSSNRTHFSIYHAN